MAYITSSRILIVRNIYKSYDNKEHVDDQSATAYLLERQTCLLHKLPNLQAVVKLMELLHLLKRLNERK